MPAASVDTFFACSLMVLLVLSAMASTSKLLYPYVNHSTDGNMAERYRQISKYMLLNEGTPINWGKSNQTNLTVFGLAKKGSTVQYDLDIDKITRLNAENVYALSYAEAFTALEISDISFRIEIKPLFETTVVLTATYVETAQTTYCFDIVTEKNGIPCLADLKGYVVAQNYTDAASTRTSNGKASLNVTVPNTVEGPAMFAVFARSVYDEKAMSFATYRFTHNSTQPLVSGIFLRLSPLNYTLKASFVASNITVSKVCALTFDYNATLVRIGNDSQSVTYSITRFANLSPILIVVTGGNSTTCFVEETAYPQVPLQFGADFATSETHSSVFAYTYPVTLNSVIYECSIRLGGPRE